MPTRTIPGTTTRYHMISVNKNGDEITPDPDAPSGTISDAILADVANGQTTDVFVWTHGWKGDVPDAFDQYDRWIGAFAKLDGDRQRMKALHPNFKEIHIGFHWPSLSWGSEDLVSGSSFSAPASTPASDLVDAHARELGDTPAVRIALTALFNELEFNVGEDTLTVGARVAYMQLDHALDLGSNGDTGTESSERAAFDPDGAVLSAFDEMSFGSSAFGKLLAPLQQLTFWTMKKRAQTVGETALHALINRIQDAAPNVRVHVMGHSFGCIVTCAALRGPGDGAPLRRPVDSCVLVQGAMSLWAMTADIPKRPGQSGFFQKLAPEGKVRGPLVTTQSRFDYAVGKLYPWAAGVANQFAYDVIAGVQPKDMPLFGAIGAFGFQGVPDAFAVTMLAADGSYAFTAKGIYNMESSEFIKMGDGVSGAHSDIDGPEVAHVIWQAATV